MNLNIYNIINNKTMETKYTKSIFDQSNYQFINDKNIDIDTNLLKFSEKELPRNSSKFELFKILLNFEQATELEKGIFEFSILYCVLNELPNEYIFPIYTDKLFSILKIINIENELNICHLLNDKNFDLRKISFMKTEELFPENNKNK